MRLNKTLLTVAFALILVLISLPTAVFANDTITVTIDGQAVRFEDQHPVIIDGRTLVPVSGVFGVLGFTPRWDGSTQTATLTRDDFTIVIIIGSATFTTNGVAHMLDVPAQIIYGRTMLPLRAVLESIGIAPGNIGWDGSTRAITIITGTDMTPPATHTPSFVGYVHNPAIPDFGRMFGIRPVDSGVTGSSFSLEYRGGGLTFDMIDEYIDFLQDIGWYVGTFEDAGISQQAQDVIYVPGHDPFHIPPALRTGSQSTLILGLLAVRVDDNNHVVESFMMGLFQGGSFAIIFDVT